MNKKIKSRELFLAVKCWMMRTLLKVHSCVHYEGVLDGQKARVAGDNILRVAEWMSMRVGG
jgi:hypothetical protein